VLPASDVGGDLIGIGAGLETHQDGINRVALGLGKHGIEDLGLTGSVEYGVGCGAASLRDDGSVVLQELRFLSVLQGDGDHRVTARGDCAPIST
jgi:hypothetical protein